MKLTRAQVRRVDQIAIEEYGFTGLMLMENAGRGATECLLEIASLGPFIILCGKGNNGGDGYVIARHLLIEGHQVQVLAVGGSGKQSPDCHINAEIVRRCGIRIDQLSNPETAFQDLADETVIVDAMMGTGAAGPLRPPYAGWVEAANRARCLRVAIDIPTGLDCDSGHTDGTAFRADSTLSFVAEKVGFDNETAKSYLGNVRVISIGVPAAIIDEAMTT